MKYDFSLNKIRIVCKSFLDWLLYDMFLCLFTASYFFSFQLTEKKKLEPINHITESSIVKKRQYFPFLIPQTQHKLLMTMTVALMGLMIWKKNIVIDKFILFSDRIQHWFHFK